MGIENVIFDFGGVLVDWNPVYLFEDYFKTESEMDYFLQHICSAEWNLEQDRGRSLAEGTEMLQNQFPEFHSLIELYYSKWERMLKSDIPGTVSILYNLKEKFNLYGLTNWSAETITIAYEKFPFFKEFSGIVVSGTEKMVKPDPRIYHLLLDRYNIKAANTIFIDDNISNIEAAREIGLQVIHFENPVQLKSELSTILGREISKTTMYL